MCGIVGLHLKNAALYPLVLMVVSMSSRGPDSTGSVLHDGDTMGGVKDVRPGETCARHGIVDRGGSPRASATPRTAAGGSMAHGRAMAGVAGGNPCPASAVLLATGLDGIDRGSDPGEQVTDDMFALSLDEMARRGIVHLPKTLDRALRNWSLATSCARRWRGCPAVTSSTTTPASSKPSSTPTTPACPSGRSTAISRSREPADRDIEERTPRKGGVSCYSLRQSLSD
jgi:hypothetical protein